ncbi:MAG: hypothetical protein IT428_33330 [Planctomycetaceae bacterium]|nr:hypothetical protein [Planctomycetaceae bacterium]
MRPARLSIGLLTIGIAFSLGFTLPASGQAPPPPPPPPPGAGEPPPPPGAAPAGRGPRVEGVIEVDAEGEGTSEEQAIRVALRSALEKAGKNEIFSETHVQDFQLMHDTIIARAEGIVTDFKVIDRRDGVGGTKRVRIKARVSKQSLVDSWGAIQNVLHQVGRPRILVSIVEKIDQQPEQQSILETEIEKRLLRSGFDLVDKGAAAELREKELQEASSDRNVEKMKAIAKDFDAQIFIVGTANANPAGLEAPYGVPIAFYNCDVQLKVYYTDTGKLLASEGIPVTRGGARNRREHSPQAGKMALSSAGQAVVERVLFQVMSQWSTQISAGGELLLEVQGLRFKDATALKRGLQEMEGITSVNMKYARQVATYQINARMRADDLAERLSDAPFDQWLEVTDLKLNRIQAHAAAADASEPAPASQP